ncbi:MAG: DUF4349 domain-containing protein [Clostridia bacterium]|nr:DUF4349 domain-containing protein [Clostridia bacterium]
MKTNIKKILCVASAIILVALILCSCGAAVKNGAVERIEQRFDAVGSEESADSKSESGVWYVDALNRAGGSDDYGYSSAVPEESFTDNGNSAKSDYSAIADSSSRKLIRDATLDIETEQYDKFVSELNKAIIQAGGYIESSSESGNTYNYTNSRYQYLTIRIPAEKLDGFLSSVSTLATVTSKEISVKEITGQYISTQSRIKALETEYDALLKILAKAEKVSDLITIQDRLTEINAELEMNKTTLKTYDEQIAYSTVTMSIDEVERVTTTMEKKTFGQELKSRLSDNLYNISQGTRSFALWFISSLPYILIFAFFAAVVLIIVIRIRKHKKAKWQNSVIQQKSENTGK